MTCEGPVRLRVNAVRFAPIIPVFQMEAARNGQAFGRVVDLVNASNAGRYLRASNSDVVLKKKTGEVVQINLYPVANDLELPSIAGSPSTTYEEQLGGEHALTVLKKLKHGHLVKWNEKERFRRGRFNPDLMMGAVHTRGSWRPPTKAA